MVQGSLRGSTAKGRATREPGLRLASTQDQGAARHDRSVARRSARTRSGAIASLARVATPGHNRPDQARRRDRSPLPAAAAKLSRPAERSCGVVRAERALASDAITWIRIKALSA